MKTFSIALLVIVLAGCSESLSGQPAPPAPPSDAHAVDNSVMGSPAVLDGLSADERTRLLIRSVAALSDAPDGSNFTYDVLRADIPLAEKDLAAAEMLRAHPGAEWVHLRQAVAAPLLELHARADSDDLDAIERYARVLLEAENPSADLMAFALGKLADRWSAAEIAAAAGATVEAADEWFAKYCTTCNARRGEAQATDSGIEAKEQALREGLAVLRPLAG